MILEHVLDSKESMVKRFDLAVLRVSGMIYKGFRGGFKLWRGHGICRDKFIMIRHFFLSVSSSAVCVIGSRQLPLPRVTGFHANRALSYFCME